MLVLAAVRLRIYGVGMREVPWWHRLSAVIPDFTLLQINNGTYKSGFATTQAAYDRAQEQLYSGLEDVERRLTKSRFLLGDK